ncbi:glycoside hydrolase family 26 protein [Curtobacterium herbarum]|uniref:GH26 domain-containing protein n=1 Tax=Curtobacterium herbarum TaxID=150122 RepID=A0ABN1ZCZ4_9MICO|nr:glycosyl hydrolase [Curtobacterium herbarum]MBM7475613.1 beta-mannanase [Curtobacterium herbarum]MCS6543526.1 glycosyl hydrolase [Curtobacterium herbarum]
MSDLDRPSSAWWAPSTKHAKRTALGMAAIVAVLALITWSIWISPSGPVSTAVNRALGVPTKQEPSADVDAMQAKLAAAQQRIWKLEGKLQSTTAQSGSRGDQVTQLKAQIADLRSQLGHARSAASAHGSGHGAGSGSGGSSSSGTTVTAGKAAGSTSGGSGQGGGPTVAPGNGGPSTDPDPGTPVDVPTKAEVLAQQSRWYGLYTAQSPFNWAEYDEVSRQVGKATNMVGYFQGFDQDFNVGAVQRSWNNGRIPMLTWETRPATTGNDQPFVAGYSNADITGGAFDDYLTKYADALKANGQPVVIRLDHEMNGSWYNWSDGTDQKNAPGSYVAMWKHVHDVFQREGANDYVIWNWSPTRIDALGNAKYQTVDYMRAYYPGADYVDWVGMSGYYRKAEETPTFATTFGRTLEQIRQVAPGKHILLSEIGATETGAAVSNGQKSQWIDSLFDALADPANSDVIGFAYFSETATTVVDGARTTNDWRLNSRADSLAAFAAGIARTDTDYDLQEVKK